VLSWPYMMPVAAALIMISMFSGETDKTWLEKGAEAFANGHTGEADRDFESAVAADPGSAKAHLCLGVIRFFEYENGIAMQPDLPQEFRDAMKNWKPGSPPPRRPKVPPLDAATKTARVTEQNSTNGAKAEEHLRRALAIEPHSAPAMEYLAALYFTWMDPVNQAPARWDEARQWYAHIAQMNPQHGFANYMLGYIDYWKAFPIIRSGTGFPRPLTEENRRRSLRAQVGLLFAESGRNFRRSLEIDPNNADAMTYLMLVRRDEAYIADTDEEALRARDEADALQGKVSQIMEANAKASGQAWPPGAKATITFERMPQASGEGKTPIPSFPPDARTTVPPAPPPPPPPPPGAARTLVRQAEAPPQS
jgi:tetratricopeptide (TPR) repeat protein